MVLSFAFWRYASPPLSYIFKVYMFQAQADRLSQTRVASPPLSASFRVRYPQAYHKVAKEKRHHHDNISDQDTIDYQEQVASPPLFLYKARTNLRQQPAVLLRLACLILRLRQRSTVPQSPCFVSVWKPASCCDETTRIIMSTAAIGLGNHTQINFAPPT